MFGVWAWRGIGSRVALLALALQLVAGFGHHHDLPSAVTGEGLAIAAPLAAPLAAPGPADDDHAPGHRDDGCAICAVLHLAAASLAPSAPALQQPPAAYVVPAAPPAGLLPPAIAATAFDARGPPHA